MQIKEWKAGPPAAFSAGVGGEQSAECEAKDLDDPLLPTARGVSKSKWRRPRLRITGDYSICGAEKVIGDPHGQLVLKIRLLA